MDDACCLPAPACSLSEDELQAPGSKVQGSRFQVPGSRLQAGTRFYPQFTVQPTVVCTGQSVSV